MQILLTYERELPTHDIHILAWTSFRPMIEGAHKWQSLKFERFETSTNSGRDHRKLSIYVRSGSLDRQTWDSIVTIRRDHPGWTPWNDAMNQGWKLQYHWSNFRQYWWAATESVSRRSNIENDLRQILLNFYSVSYIHSVTNM